ncbi:hypothetical protein BJ170DRAFT_275683 [Xylariales sp. AK1849]|nr:hypothetical protein BJ170DRAFT_275683 [Xylariales sp. AK1849]
MPQRTDPSVPAQWPPRSPREALASTPGGRERLRRMAERASPSPSPLKKSRSASALASRSGNARADGFDDDEDMDGEEEDEETLQLKLEAIQAKLKLKALQKKQRKGTFSGSSDAENGSMTSLNRPNRPGSTVPDVLAASRAQSRAAMLAEGPKVRPQSQAQVDIQVPASPVRKIHTAQSQRSPSRVLLGIDKGLKAKDVSLKRASSLRKPSETPQDGQTGSYLRRAHTPAPGNKANSSARQERPKSFSERLATARTEEASRVERQERIQKVRNKAFEIGQDEVERYKTQATEIPDIPLEAEIYSREEILAGAGIRRSNDIEPGSSMLSADSNAASAIRKKKQPLPSEVPEDEATSFEPFSSTHLSKRILPHNLLTRTFAGKKTYLIPDLLAQIKAPNFQLPEIEQDIVVLGILSSKSDPKSHKPTPGNPDLKEKKSRFAEEDHRGKYMVVTMVDLQWELDLFLFNSAFQRYWKLVPGTLIAILNPTVMPPPKGREATGRFSLVLNSDEDAVLEIGTARDLGFCKSVKKDGALCNSWVNRKRTEFCEFHMNAALEKKRLARIDLNSGTGMGFRDNKHGEKSTGWKDKDYDSRRKGNYDRSTQSHFFVSQASAATLLDSDHLLSGQVTDRAERKDAIKRRLASQEKERAIMKQLGSTGRGAGREYMKHGKLQMGSHVSSNANGADGLANMDEQPKPPDARSLGLIQPKTGGNKIHLSPVKRKRDNSAASAANRDFGTGSSSGGASLGWGGSLKDKLTRMKEGEKLDRTAKSTSKAVEHEKKERAGQPARKKTRFVTEKGIREAGRESLGVELGRGGGEGLSAAGDSDDELEILM